MFPICGKHAVLAALKSDRPYRYKALMIAHNREKDEEVKEILNLASRKSIRFQKADLGQLNHLTPGFLSHQGIILTLVEHPQPVTLEEFIPYVREKDKALVVALDSITDHANIGSIARAAAAFGGEAIVSAQDRSAPLIHPAVWRVAQGAAESLRFIEVVNLSRSFEELKEENFWVIGASSKTQAKDIREVRQWPKKLVLVLGSEGIGLRRLVDKTCDEIVRIPQAPSEDLDSLNVGQAAAIMLWEIYKSAHSSAG